VELYLALAVLGALWRFVTSPGGAAFGGFLGGLAALIAVLLAPFGFVAWKRELRGTTKYHVAKRVLEGVFDLRRQLHLLRIPIDPRELASYHSTADYPEDLAPGAVKAFRDHPLRLGVLELAEYKRRFDDVYDARMRLHVAELEARAIWGAAAREPLKRLTNGAKRFVLRSMSYFQLEKKRLNEEDTRPRGPRLERLRRLAYLHGKSDWVENYFDRAEQACEDWYSRYLR